MSTLTSDDAAPTCGFPNFTDYLPIGMWHPTAVYWPAAQNRLQLFFAACDRANDKLFAAFTARLPCALGNWWIRSWADEFLWRTAEGIHASVADVRALYDFGRKLDGQLQLTGTPPGNKHPRDAEFTYYVNPFRREGPNGTAVPEPFATFTIDYRFTDQNSPTRFPGMRVRDPSTRVWLGCEEFLKWAAFLATQDALTQQQMDELGHIAYSESGTDGWCESQGTHGEQCGAIAKRILSRLRDAIVSVSDSLRIAVVTVPQGLLFADALALVSQWLEPAEAKAGGKGGAEAATIAAKEEPKGQGGTPPAVPKSDGPFGADGFRFAGIEVRFGRAAKSYALMLSLWDSDSNGLSKARGVEDVMAQVYGEEHGTEDSTFRQMCTDTRNKLSKFNFPLTITTLNGKVLLERLTLPMRSE